MTNNVSAPSRVTVAAVQMSCGVPQRGNLEKALGYVQQAAQRGARIICLQELFNGRYPCQREDHAAFALAEPIPGPTTQQLAEASQRLGVVIVASLFERRAPGLYHNTAVVLDADGSFVGAYRKMHIPDDPLYYEKFYFTPGDLGFRCFATRYGKIGVLVCWDQWYPEAARLTALRGAELLVYPTAIGWLADEKLTHGPSQHSAWETMMRSHAIANGVYVAAPNRVGREDALQFWGASFICDPYGNVLQRGSHDQDEVVLADCDWSVIDVARTHWPFLRDRRIDAYDGLTQRFLDSEPGGPVERVSPARSIQGDARGS